MITPVVSIIIATYNSSSTIREALMSVQEQLFQDWECIIVDGASKDNTIDIVKEYEAKDSRFRHISEPDNGIYDAFNKGWKIAKGEWIHYLGSDDKLTIEGLQDLLKDSHDNAAIVSGNVYIEKIDGIIKKNISVGFGGCHQGKITRRSIIEKIGGFDESYPILADAELVFKIKYGGYSVDNVDTFVAYFAMDGTSQKISNLLKIGKERYRLHQAYPQSTRYPFLYTCRICILQFLSICYRKMIMQKNHISI